MPFPNLRKENMAPHLLQHMPWSEPCGTVCTGKTPETKMSVNKGMRSEEFIKVIYTCSKQLGNLMCTETEMFRVIMSEINKQNKLSPSSHYSLLGSSQLPPISMHPQHSLQRPLEVHPRHGGENLHHFCCSWETVGGGQEAAGGCGHWDRECTLGLLGAGVPHNNVSFMMPTLEKLEPQDS